MKRLSNQRIFGQPRAVEVVEQTSHVVVQRLERLQIVAHIALELPFGASASLRIGAVELLDDRIVEAVPGGTLRRVHPPDHAFEPVLQPSLLVLAVHLQVVDRIHVVVRGDRHLLRRSGRTPLVIVVEGLRNGERPVLIQRQVARVGHPVAVLRLVVDEQAEGLLGIALAVEPREGLVRDEVRDVAFVAERVAGLQDEVRVVVVALIGDNLPVVEARREALQMPFADDRRFVARPAQQLREGLLRTVEDTGRIVVETVLVRMLACEHAGAARAAQRIGHEAVCEADALGGYPVEVGCRGVAAVVTAHHLGRMVVGHDVEDIHRARRRLAVRAAGQRQRRQTAQPQPIEVLFFHAVMNEWMKGRRTPRHVDPSDGAPRFPKPVTRPSFRSSRPTSAP